VFVLVLAAVGFAVGEVAVWVEPTIDETAFLIF